MKPKRQKREIIRTLSLGKNLRLAMNECHMTFKELAKKGKVSSATAYGLVERTPFLVTEQLLRIGKILGFTEHAIREKVWEDRLAKKRPYSRKERLYQILGELIDLFDSSK